MKDVWLFISATFVGAFIGIAIGFLLIGLINGWNGWDIVKWFLDEIFHWRRNNERRRKS